MVTEGIRPSVHISLQPHRVVVRKHSDLRVACAPRQHIPNIDNVVSSPDFVIDAAAGPTGVQQHDRVVILGVVVEVNNVTRRNSRTPTPPKSIDKVVLIDDHRPEFLLHSELKTTHIPLKTCRRLCTEVRLGLNRCSVHDNAWEGNRRAGVSLAQKPPHNRLAFAQLEVAVADPLTVSLNDEATRSVW